MSTLVYIADCGKRWLWLCVLLCGLVRAQTTLTITGNGSLTGSFTLNSQATLTVQVASSSNGGGTVTGPGGINCTALCSYGISNSSISLTATPATGSTFVAWETGPCIGSSSSTCSFTITTSLTVTAGFSYNYPNTTTITTTPSYSGCGPNGLPVGGGSGFYCLPFAPQLSNFYVNSTAFDTTFNATHNCGTVIWDQFSKNNNSTAVTQSGGSGDFNGSLHGHFVALSANGASVLLNINVSGSCFQVYNNGAGGTSYPYTVSCTALPGSTGACPRTDSAIAGGFGFSKQSENTFWHISSANCNGSGCGTNSVIAPGGTTNSKYAVIYQATVNCDTNTFPTTSQCLPNSAVPYTMHAVYDLRNCPGFGASGSALSAQSASSVSIHGFDQQISVNISFTGGQDTAIYKATWDRNLGCKVLDTSTGWVYGWCNATPCDPTRGPLNAYYQGQETTCYGGFIHDSFEKSTQYAKVSQKVGGWSNCGSTQAPVVWDMSQSGLLATGVVNVSGTTATVTSGATPQNYWIGATSGSPQNNIVIGGIANEVVGVSGSTLTLANSMGTLTGAAFSIKSLCNSIGTAPCTPYSNTAVQFCPQSGANCSGHDAAGFSQLFMGNNPNANRRPWSNMATNTVVANITGGNHPLLTDDPFQYDLGLAVYGSQNSIGAGNTTFGYDNPPSYLESELFGIPSWLTFTYSGTNPAITRFYHLPDPEQLQANVDSVNFTSTTAVTVTTSTTFNAFPGCATITGSCGGGAAWPNPTPMEINVTGCGAAFSGNLASITTVGNNQTAFTMTGTAYTVGTPACSGAVATASTITFGVLNAICFATLDANAAVCGYGGFGQLGADQTGGPFGGAIMVRLNF